MPNYDLDRLGEKEFERLVQALIKKVIGVGTITFGEGPDGAREATYSGRAPYPSEEEQWKGEWIFQAKYHDTRRIGPDKARKQVINDLKTELEKIVVKYKRTCHNYILVTNVPLSSVPHIGTHDKIAQKVVPSFLDKISNIHVWGYDDLCRTLDGFPEVRQTYFHLITPGDLIAELLDRQKHRKNALTETIQLYLSTSFEREQYAQLDQAGEIGERPMPLRRVFIDLDVEFRSEKDLRAYIESSKERLSFRIRQLHGERMSATETLISSDFPRAVLIGGPGQGKSTLGQFIAQIHRAYVLDKANQLDGVSMNFTPKLVRVPFRIILKDYAQWIVDSQGPHSLERFLADIIEERASRKITQEGVQEIIKNNPTLIILDGLDEVTNRKLRSKMLELLTDFIIRCEEVLKADLQIIATSRPTGYSDQFDPSRFLHLTLSTMDNDKVMEYIERWIKAKGLESTKGKSLRSSIQDCIADPNFSPLMNTPLQVTIFILIILNGGTPPRQREELFDEYLEVIYKRERAKSKTIIITEKRLLFGLHQYMGYLLHRRAAESSDTRSRMNEKEFSDEVFRYLRHEDPYSDATELKVQAKQMIDEARERLVLLVEFDDNFFGFELRSIQEFFAAGWLADRAIKSEQRFKRFQAIALPPHWRNVALYFAGRVGRCYPGEAAQILEACREIDRNRPDSFTKRGAWLALEIAVDRSFGPNRILQRSAIEYALTLLDGVLYRDKRSQLISQLRQLPQDDFQQHVVPLLVQRLEKTKLSVNFYTTDISSVLMDDKFLIEKAIKNSLESDKIESKLLLQKALEYRLLPKFIKSEFGQIINKLEDEFSVDLFLKHFVNNPEYITEVWRNTKISKRVVNLTFETALENPSRENLRQFRDLSFSVLGDDLEQLKLAWELISLTLHIERETTGLGVPILFHHDEFRHFTRNIFDLEPNRIRNLEGIVLDASAIIELRASAFALLSRILFLSPDHNILYQLAEQLTKSLNEKQVEIFEKILFRLKAPSIDILNKAPELHYSKRELFHPHFFQEMLNKSSERLEVSSLHVLDPIKIQRWDDIIGIENLSKGLPKELSIDTMRIISRFGIYHTTYEREPQINLKFVSRTLNVIFDILTNVPVEEWRARAALSRLTSIPWRLTRRRSSEEIKELEKSLLKICETLDSKLNNIYKRRELGELLARIAEIPVSEHILTKMLEIFSKMHEGCFSERMSRGFYPWHLSQQGIERLFNISVASSSGHVLHGFSKWYASLMSIIQEFRHPGLDIPRLKLDKDRFINIVQNTKDSTHEGVLLLLAHSGLMSFEDTLRLIDFSKEAKKPVDRSWAVLIKGTIRNSDSKEAIIFLEHILSKTKSPNAVKYAALEEYERIAKSSTIDIREQEIHLGLPLQDINQS